MNDQAQIEDGRMAANIIATASPFVSQLFATVWNHLPGGIAQMLIPAVVVHNAVETVCAKLSSAVQGQVISFSIPSGMVHDVVVELETHFPGFIHAIHQTDPVIATAMTAIGALPAPPPSPRRITAVVLDQLVSEPVHTIAATGLLGALLVVAGVWIVLLTRQNRALSEARVVDWQTMGKITENNTLASSARTEAQLASTRVGEIQAQATQMLVSQNTQLMTKIDASCGQVEAMRDDVQRVREAILQNGGRL